MKNHSQLDRLKFALAGLRLAWQQETSLRTEGGVFVVVLAYVFWKHPSIFWWVAILAAAAMAFISELMNTAVENVCDALHPDHHVLIGAAKDCASAAVLIANTFALIILVLFIWQTW